MKKINQIRKQRQQRASREEALGEVNALAFRDFNLMPKDNPKEAWNSFINDVLPRIRRLEMAQTVILRDGVTNAQQAWNQAAELTLEPLNDEELLKEWDCARVGRTDELEAFTMWFDAVTQTNEITTASARKVDFISNVSCSALPQNPAKGNGLLANVDLEGGDMILDIPRMACISSDLDDLHKNSAEVNKAWKDAPIKHLTLPLSNTSVYDHRRKGFERLMVETGKNAPPSVILLLRLLWEAALPLECSLYAPYLSILPATYNVPLFWTISELETLPNLNLGLTAARVAGEFLAHLRQYSRTVQTLFQQEASQRAIPLSLLTWSRFRWALGATMTRKNPIPTSTMGGMALAFLPGFDLSNHDNRAKDTHNDCVYSVPSNSIQVCCQRAVEKGAQVFIRYDVDRPTELCDFLGADLQASRENPRFTAVRSFAAWLTNGGFVPDVERFVYGPLPPLDDGFHPSDSLLIRVNAPAEPTDPRKTDHHRLMTQIMQRLRFPNPMTVSLGRPPVWAHAAPLLGFLRITQSTHEELKKFEKLVMKDLEEMQREETSTKFAFGRCFVPLTLGVECEQRVLKWLKSRCELILKHGVTTFAKQGAHAAEAEDDKATLEHLKQAPSVARDVCFVAWRDRKLLRGVITEIEAFLHPETGTQLMASVFKDLDVNPCIANDVTII